MLKYKSSISSKDKKEIYEIINSIPDYYKDFYITKDNLRLFIKDNIDIFFNCLKKGDKIIFGSEGIIFLTGFSDDYNRIYLKILSNSEEDTFKLMQMLDWNCNYDLFAKIKKDSPIRIILIKKGFLFKGSRGREILLFRPKREKNNDK